MAITWYNTGKSVIGFESVAAGESMAVTAPANSVYKIQNIIWAARVTVNYYDGTNTVEFFDSETEDQGGSFQFSDLPCHDDAYLRVKNEDGSTQVIVVTGVIWG